MKYNWYILQCLTVFRADNQPSTELFSACAFNLATASNFRTVIPVGCNSYSLCKKKNSISLLWFWGEYDSDPFLTGAVRFSHFCALFSVFLDSCSSHFHSLQTLPMVHLCFSLSLPFLWSHQRRRPVKRLTHNTNIWPHETIIATIHSSPWNGPIKSVSWEKHWEDCSSRSVWCSSSVWRFPARELHPCWFVWGRKQCFGETGFQPIP